MFDDSKIPAIAQQTKQANIYVTATLNNFALIVQQATDLDTFLKNPELRYVAPWTLDNFEPNNDRYKNRFGSDKYEILRNLLAIQRKLLKAFNGAGVPLMAGTDATEVGPVAGFGLPHELEEFVQDGLTPYQALETATTHPAAYLQQSSEFGTIHVGKRADMLLLTGDPLNDISNIKSIAGVMVRGHWLDAKDLGAELREVPNRYRQEQIQVETMLRNDPHQAVRYLTGHDPLGRLQAFCLAEVAAKQSRAELENTLRRMRAADASGEMVSEDNVNTLGYALMNKKMYPQAIAVLTLNTEDFPRSANTWDSLADAYSHSGDDSKAVENYRKALATDEGYSNANEARKFIEEHTNQ